MKSGNRWALQTCLASLIVSPCAFAAATTEEDVVAPAVVAAYETCDRFVDGKRHSADLRLRIALSFVSVFRNTANDFAATTIATARLVELTRGSTDPMVLALMSKRCSLRLAGGLEGCDSQDFARRWTDADTQNALAWLTLAARSQERGDAATARMAFERASRASLWHEFYDDVVRLIRDTQPPSLTEQERLIFDERAFALAGFEAPDVGHEVNKRCKAVEAAAPCDRLLATMSRDGGSMTTLWLAAAVSERAGLPEAATRRHQFNALKWAREQAVANDAYFFVADIRDPADIRSWVVRAELAARLGEVPYLHDLLRRSGLSTDDAGTRYASEHAESEARRSAEVADARSRAASTP